MSLDDNDMTQHVLDLAKANRRKACPVPEEHKDEKYWSRRQRNNIAAKKSRDAKKELENAMRQKVVDLEKENVFLRRELTLLKKALNLPTDVCLLTDAEKDDCLLELGSDNSVLKQFNNITEYRSIRNHQQSPPVAMPRFVSESTLERLRESTDTHVDSRVNAPKQLSHVSNNCVSDSSNKSVEYALNLKRTISGDADNIPADLSVRKRPRKSSSPCRTDMTSQESEDSGFSADENTEVVVKREMFSEEVLKVQSAFRIKTENTA